MLTVEKSVRNWVGRLVYEWDIWMVASKAAQRDTKLAEMKEYR